MALLRFLKTKSAIPPTSEEMALGDGVTRSANAAVRREIEAAPNQVKKRKSLFHVHC